MGDREANELKDDGDEPQEPSRRSFLDKSIVGGGAFVGLASLYPALRFLEPIPEAAADSVVVAKVADFPPGTSKSVRVGETPVLVIRDETGSFRAFVAICPHLQCVVRFAELTNDIACACHGGTFSLSGSPKAGPPKQPLKVLRVNVVGEDVVVT